MMTMLNTRILTELQEFLAHDVQQIGPALTSQPQRPSRGWLQQRRQAQ